MDTNDRRLAEREAYATYVRLQWELYGLPGNAPERELLAEAVRRADRYWRGLVGVPDVTAHGDERLRRALGQRTTGAGPTRR